MKKKFLVGLISLIAVTGGVAGMSAFEAHIINVTAHIENALSVPTDPIAFGTVFPQEYLEHPFTISLSDSFKNQQRDTIVSYQIKQKPKCFDPDGNVYFQVSEDAQGNFVCVDPDGDNDATMLPSLCPFLSKTSTSTNTTSVPSYFTPASGNTPATCATPTPEIALGQFNLISNPNHTADNWLVDLKVPPIKGMVGQDWPASCAAFTVPTDSTDYGCDLWVEVTGIATSTPQ